jgi:hypothetical protein
MKKLKEWFKQKLCRHICIPSIISVDKAGYYRPATKDPSTQKEHLDGIKFSSISVKLLKCAKCQTIILDKTSFHTKYGEMMYDADKRIYMIDLYNQPYSMQQLVKEAKKKAVWF